MRSGAIQRGVKARPNGSARDHAGHMIEALTERLYPRTRYALATEVKSVADGFPYEVLRRADAIAIDHYPPGGGLRFEGFELKASRSDLLRELNDPEKSGPFALFCSRWWLMVAAPWKKVVHDLSELHAMWGLIENGTGGAVVVLEAQERQAEPPTPGFVRALFRALQLQAERVEQMAEVGGAPMVTVVEVVDRRHVELACGHRGVRPLNKVMPRRMPCALCAAEDAAEAPTGRPGPARARPAAETGERRVA